MHSYVPNAREISVETAGVGTGGIRNSGSTRCPNVDTAGHADGVAATAPDNAKDVVRRGADFLDKYFGLGVRWYRDTEAAADEAAPDSGESNELENETQPEEEKS